MNIILNILKPADRSYSVYELYKIYFKYILINNIK